MDEAQIAELVAKAAAKAAETAVAGYDARTSVGDELWANSETIVATLSLVATLMLGLFRWISRKQKEITDAFKVVADDYRELDKRMALRERYEEDHDGKDLDAHARLERGDDNILRELRELRAESSKQHDDLGQIVRDAIDKGEAGRQRLYGRIDATDEKLATVSENVATLIGYHEARKEGT